MKKSMTANEKRLIRRYLVWCYKTTKEDLDKIERYYTQYVADKFMLKKLSKKAAAKKTGSGFKQMVKDFEEYIMVKKNNADKRKFKDKAGKQLSDEYVYLRERFAAIEKAIVSFLGKKELASITRLYEDEMTGRILQAREHH